MTNYCAMSSTNIKVEIWREYKAMMYDVYCGRDVNCRLECKITKRLKYDVCVRWIRWYGQEKLDRWCDDRVHNMMAMAMMQYDEDGNDMMIIMKMWGQLTEDSSSPWAKLCLLERKYFHIFTINIWFWTFYSFLSFIFIKGKGSLFSFICKQSYPA